MWHFKTSLWRAGSAGAGERESGFGSLFLQDWIRVGVLHAVDRPVTTVPLSPLMSGRALRGFHALWPFGSQSPLQHFISVCVHECVRVCVIVCKCVCVVCVCGRSLLFSVDLLIDVFSVRSFAASFSALPGEFGAAFQIALGSCFLSHRR